MEQEWTSERAGELLGRMQSEIERVVIGQTAAVQDVLVCLIAGGHVLLEGVPGLGKTLLVRALAAVFGGASTRIQFTPDLMPADVTGHALFNMQTSRFEVRRGPVFTNLLLADEINRAPAKTQAALLEVMQEKQVTIEGESFPVAEPFMVLATQNPVEQDGTYPLPEAELDRFMMKVLIDYPDDAAERAIVRAQTAGRVAGGLNVEGLDQVVTPETVLAIRQCVADTTVDEAVLDYAVRIVRQTRTTVGIAQGASPRASIALVSSARVRAVFAGRDFIVPDDVKGSAYGVLRHRLQLSADMEIEGQDADSVLETMLAGVDAPRT